MSKRAAAQRVFKKATPVVIAALIDARTLKPSGFVMDQRSGMPMSFATVEAMREHCDGLTELGTLGFAAVPVACELVATIDLRERRTRAAKDAAEA